MDLIQIKKQKEQDLLSFMKEQERRETEEKVKLDKEKCYETQRKMIEQLELDKIKLMRENQEMM
jgi:hypothetical protein